MLLCQLFAAVIALQASGSSFDQSGGQLSDRAGAPISAVRKAPGRVDDLFRAEDRSADGVLAVGGRFAMFRPFDDVSVALVESDGVWFANDGSGGALEIYPTPFGDSFVLRSPTHGRIEVRPLGHGVSRAEQRPLEVANECGVAHDAAPLDNRAGGDGGLAGGCSGSNRLDVAILWTPEARAAAGGDAAILARAHAAVSATNEAFASSGIDITVHLVATGPVAQSEAGSSYNTILNRLSTIGDGFYEEAHAMRESSAADLVMMFVNNPEYCGMAWIAPSQPSYGFSLVTWYCDPIVAAHEWGHNFGCCHAPGDGGGCQNGGVYPYSLGHRFTGGSGNLWRTVMAYSPGTRISRFSSPNVLYDGVPTGLPGNGSEGRDNVRTILETRASVTGFRCGVTEDSCEGATEAVIGDNPFSTVTATTSPDPVDETQCSGTYLDWGTANKDVWFRYTAPIDGYLDLHTCLANSFDTSMVVYTGSCGALTQIACNGDGNGLADCQAFFSRITGLLVTAGTTYYIRIGGWSDPGTGVPESGIGSLTLQLFDYNCTGSAQANDCAINATVLSYDTFRDINNTNCNTDGPIHPASSCASGSGNISNDLWYRFRAQTSGNLVVQTCVVNGGPAATFDTKLALYDMGTNPAVFNFDSLPDALIECNDDGGTDCLNAGGVFPSSLSAAVIQGRWYLIRVGSAGTPGTARVTFDFPEPCILPAQTVLESEPCGGGANDGCTAGQMPQPITLGSTVRGRLWLANESTKDVDWYQVTLDSNQGMTINVYSSSVVTLQLLKATNKVGCQPELIVQGSGGCPNTLSWCLEPGTYFIAVALDPAYGATPCGSTDGRNDYVVEFIDVEEACASIVDPFCYSGGHEIAWSNNQVPPSGTNNLGGLVACATNPAFPNCSGGGTGANKYARVFDADLIAGLIAGEINCFEVGFFSVRRTANATSTGCINGLSDLPLPATVYICHDVDGGTPRNLSAFAGDGNDLEILSTRPVLVPGMTDTGAINFDPPLCLKGVSGNIVVVLDIPSFLVAQGNIPASQGYGLRPAGLTVAGQPSQVFVRLSCADAAGQFIAAETLGSSFTPQWFVGASGRYWGCDTCPADCTRDGFVNSSDLSAMFAMWDQTDTGEGPFYPDVDGDGVVGAGDLAAILDAWGPCP